MVLLGSKDPAPFSIFNADSSSNLLFTSDHNGSAIPTKLKNLGVPLNELRRHVAYDIGIDAVAHALSARFNATLIVANYSRLVIDCNRHPGSAGSIPSVSDNTVVPGNKNLSDDDIKSREDEIFDAYHSSVGNRISIMRSENKNPILISLHSFTPVIGGQFRPWEIGILFKDDERLSAPLINKLREQKDLNIGDNKPYSGSEPAGYTVDYHVEPLSLPSVAVEFRQDLIEFETGAVRWANIFGDALDHVLTSKIS
ncbi:MAG: hypothetical protein CMM17_06680 [Rhodospirillaceae bacterium]|nr:hypothetical protein [Rhodospirillaceae bacterium]|tara:strand:- start:362 stop:1126 length:765 start_codon:yes stop_codon:yes gene_type:complete